METALTNEEPQEDRAGLPPVPAKYRAAAGLLISIAKMATVVTVAGLIGTQFTYSARCTDWQSAGACIASSLLAAMLNSELIAALLWVLVAITGAIVVWVFIRDQFPETTMKDKDDQW